MFGKNEVTPPFQKDDGSLLVNSIFYTIQGEGPDAGRPAVFVRLSKCHLRCWFCDTEFESGTQMTKVEVLAKVAEKLDGNKNCNLVVITGGEPLLQNFLPLTRKLNEIGFEVSVETAGAMWLPGLDLLFTNTRSIHGNLVVCSPKTPRLHPNIIPVIGAYKYILSRSNACTTDGLPKDSTQVKGAITWLARPSDRFPNVPVYVQPMDEQEERLNRHNLQSTVHSSMRHGYRLGIQMHKIADLE